MARLRWIWRNAVEAATLSAGSAATDYPVSNLQIPHLVQTYRTGSSTAAEWVVADLGSAVNVTAVALLGHDLDGTETLTLEANNADSWSLPAWSRTLTHRDDALAEIWSPAAGYRYWRLRVDKAAAADVRNLGVLVLGPHYECPVNPARAPWGWDTTDPSVVHTTPGGQHHAERAEQLDVFTAHWDATAPTALVIEVREMVASRGATRPLFVAWNMDQADPLAYSLWGRLSRALGPRGYTGAEGRRSLELEVTQWR